MKQHLKHDEMQKKNRNTINVYLTEPKKTNLYYYDAFGIFSISQQECLILSRYHDFENVYVVYISY